MFKIILLFIISIIFISYSSLTLYYLDKSSKYHLESKQEELINNLKIATGILLAISILLSLYSVNKFRLKSGDNDTYDYKSIFSFAIPLIISLCLLIYYSFLLKHLDDMKSFDKDYKIFGTSYSIRQYLIIFTSILLCLMVFIELYLLYRYFRTD
jgi:heme/copper-type cytochrome/quinol oxidase subunit 2